MSNERSAWPLVGCALFGLLIIGVVVLEHATESCAIRGSNVYACAGESHPAERFILLIVGFSFVFAAGYRLWKRRRLKKLSTRS